jgi:hypothetical protein
MRQVGFLLLLLLAGSVNHLHAQESFKLWDKKSPLVWSDFKGPVDESNTSLAMSYTAIYYRYKVQLRPGSKKPTLTFEVESRFSYDKSWSKVEKQSQDNLNYQQAYFDITEYFARILKKQLNGYAYTADYRNEVAQIYKHIADQKTAMKNRFYAATAFAGDTAITRQWTDYINDLLANTYSLDVAISKEPVVAIKSTQLQKLWEANDPLHWSDFKGKVDDTSEFWALTYSGTSFTTKVTDGKDKPTLRFDVRSYFNTNLSWTKPSLQSEGLLRHEQMHFNISEFYSRQLNKALNSYVYTANYINEILQIVNANRMQRQAMQDKYDNLTEHRKNAEMQKQWEKFLTNLLSKEYTADEAMQNAPHN